jgi:hypothetical protein
MEVSRGRAVTNQFGVSLEVIIAVRSLNVFHFLKIEDVRILHKGN